MPVRFFGLRSCQHVHFVRGEQPGEGPAGISGGRSLAATDETAPRLLVPARAEKAYEACAPRPRLAAQIRRQSPTRSVSRLPSILTVIEVSPDFTSLDDSADLAGIVGHAIAPV
jgi:hypothetical protein